MPQVVLVSEKVLVVSGFPTAGKSSVGEVLKSRFGLRVADLDDLIEAAAGKPLKNIIREEGEDAFRDCESKALENALTAKEIEVLVVGGGAVLREANRKLIAAHRHVSLGVLPEIAAARALGDEQRAVSKGIFPQRPLLAPTNASELCFDSLLAKVVELKCAREAVLREADLRINTSWVSADVVASILASVLMGEVVLLPGSLLIPVSSKSDDLQIIVEMKEPQVGRTERISVNLLSGKNLFETYEPAKLIRSEIGDLSTLSKREFKTGLVEVVTSGSIREGESFSWVEVLQLDKMRTEKSANFVFLTKLSAAACLCVEFEAILAAVLQSETLNN